MNFWFNTRPPPRFCLQPLEGRQLTKTNPKLCVVFHEVLLNFKLRCTYTNNKDFSAVVVGQLKIGWFYELGKPPLTVDVCNVFWIWYLSGFSPHKRQNHGPGTRDFKHQQKKTHRNKKITLPFHFLFESFRIENVGNFDSSFLSFQIEDFETSITRFLLFFFQSSKS